MNTGYFPSRACNGSTVLSGNGSARTPVAAAPPLDKHKILHGLFHNGNAIPCTINAFVHPELKARLPDMDIYGMGSVQWMTRPRRRTNTGTMWRSKTTAASTTGPKNRGCFPGAALPFYSGCPMPATNFPKRVSSRSISTMSGGRMK